MAREFLPGPSQRLLLDFGGPLSQELLLPSPPRVCHKSTAKAVPGQQEKARAPDRSWALQIPATAFDREHPHSPWASTYGTRSSTRTGPDAAITRPWFAP